MSQERIRSFEEFWPFYVREHSKRGTRALHFIGTTAAMACVASGIVLRKRWLFALAPVVGYGPSWIGHFFVEKNRPATFTYPLWSLQADLLMWSMTLRGTMDAEVERVLAADRADEPVEPGVPGHVEMNGDHNGAGNRETLN